MNDDADLDNTKFNKDGDSANKEGGVSKCSVDLRTC